MFTGIRNYGYLTSIKMQGFLLRFASLPGNDAVALSGDAEEDGSLSVTP